MTLTMIPIYTSSWSTKLPANIARIGISRSVPRGHPPGYRRLRELEPGPWLHSVGALEFHQRYMAQLHALDARAVLDRILALAEGSTAAALLCFESPADRQAWCHRGHVAAWLHEQAGIEVREFGLEHDGCGWSRPKLFAELRSVSKSGLAKMRSISRNM